MNSESNPEEKLFDLALSLPTPEAQAAFLSEACGDNEDLRQRVEALLRAHQQDDGLLDRALTELTDVAQQSPEPKKTVYLDLATAQTATPATEKAGDRIGPYNILQQIGEGGCGVVFMAEQLQPIRRRVALKVIKLGMDTKSVIARFEAERQALAMMDHPNIAKVLDAGATKNGRPYFVMELVRGIPITKYCDQNNLPTVQRLGLFVKVCQAIEHAHQKGVIHRDIKPTNILVTLHDGVPVPKVIDFGIAKATDARLTDKTLFTAFEQFIGTPAYMSPEQAEMSGLDIDTRADIYSLGVLLYELLTGKLPFDPATLYKAGLDEIRRTIREVEPPRPSSRLSTLANADLSTIAKQRAIDAGRLSALISGDLDWIAMKALDKDRTRRYENASAFAQDVQRHLNNEPVTACPPSVSYLLQKFVRRHSLAFVAAGAVALALIAGAGLATWQAVRAGTAERATAIERNKAMEERDRARNAEQEANAERAKAIAEKQRSEEAREQAEKAQANEAKLRIEADMARLYAESSMNVLGAEIDRLAAAQLPSATHPTYYRMRIKFWRDALARSKTGLDKYPNAESLRFQVTQIQGALANACFEAGDLSQSKEVSLERLATTRDSKWGLGGDVIHQANALLGRIALRENDRKTAGEYLIKAGQAPGSPNLDSFGPEFTLAAELLKAGEEDVVLQYLDLVEKFWANERDASQDPDRLGSQKAAVLNEWREEIRAGRTPALQWPNPSSKQTLENLVKNARAKGDTRQAADWQRRLDQLNQSPKPQPK